MPRLATARNVARAYRNVGARLAISEALAPLRRRGTMTLRTPLCDYPLKARVGTSDLATFRTLFARGERNEYNWLMSLKAACSLGLARVYNVIDCGANAGYASAMMLSAFPDCRVAAIEPDPENFALLQKNLAPYGDRVRLYNAGVWSHSTELVIDERPYRYNNTCSLQVRERREDDGPGVPAVDLNSVISDMGWGHVSILKMDIEGAECVVFGQGDRSWAGKVDALIVEVHDDSHFGSGTEALAQIADRFHLTRAGDLAFGRNRACVTPPVRFSTSPRS